MTQERHPKEQTKQLRRSEHLIKKRKKNTEQSKQIAKPILDKWAVHIVRKKAVWTNKEGNAQVDQNKGEDYDPETYDTDIVLWEPPLNWIRLEFEDTPEKNRKIINKIESNLKALGYDYCITDHGGKSPYINLVFKDIPLNNDNKLAKIQFAKSIMDQQSFSQLDRTNLGFTLSPVIGHQHWKPKYNGAIHKMTRGTNPLKQDNKFPKDILKDIKKAKKTYKKSYQNLIQNDNWVKDFLINFCTTADISKWANRHQVIEKNLAILIINHPDRDEIIQRYNKNKEPDPANIETWFPDIINGKYTECNPGELKKYINDNDLDYIIVDKQGPTPTEKPKKLTKDEKKQARDYLVKPSFLVDTVKEIQKNVTGEEDTILALIILATTRLVKNAIPESTNLLLSDKTGLGKDHVTKETLNYIIPDHQHLHVTKMTPESFTYWHTNEEDWTWDDKTLHFEDISQQLLNCSTFKVMSSGDNYAIVVKDQETLEIPINGKPCMILTSHHANPQDEALRRFRIGGLNETKTQTRDIMNEISQNYAGLKNTKQDEMLKKTIQHLRSFPVVIPFAELIHHFFPDDSIMRTLYRCFLDYIAGSCIFHQGQRKLTKNGELIATPDDYMIARMVLIYTTSNPRMIPLSKEYRDILQILKTNVEPMTVNEIDVKCDKSKPWLYKHLPRICATELVVKGKKPNEQANKPVMTYQYNQHLNAQMIPTWKDLSNQILDIGVKTNKTNNTPNDSLLEKWFYTHDIKPIIPKGNVENSYLVLYGRRIPLNGKVLLVFSVLSVFFRERDKKRFSKYFVEKEEMALPEKPKDQQTTIGETDKKTGQTSANLHESKNEPEKKSDPDEKKMYHRKLKDFLSKHPKTKFDLDKIGVAVGLSGPKGKGLLKEIMNEDIIENGEHSFFMKHDDTGYYWSTRRT